MEKTLEPPLTFGQLALGFETTNFRVQAFYSSNNSRDFVNFGYVANNINRTIDRAFNLSLEYDLLKTEQALVTTLITGNQTRKESVGVLGLATETVSGDQWIGGPFIKGTGTNIRTDGKYDFSNTHRIRFGIGLIGNFVSKPGFYSTRVSF
jgi:hypothetical protein